MATDKSKLDLLGLDDNMKDASKGELNIPLKKKSKATTKSVNISMEVHEKLDKVVDEKGYRSKKELIEAILLQWLGDNG